LARDVVVEALAAPDAGLVAYRTGFPRQGEISWCRDRKKAGSDQGVITCQTGKPDAFVRYQRPPFISPRRYYLRTPSGTGSACWSCWRPWRTSLALREGAAVPPGHPHPGDAACSAAQWSRLPASFAPLASPPPTRRSTSGKKIQARRAPAANSPPKRNTVALCNRLNGAL
jgi:hypothetical protein